ncbi:MAG: tRNA-dihydrouridine synthase family protein [Verrucomicrobia bacterium]|nr:tRNA-dihydrouridine synthase family protein [Verrucomicrobiota bacterium]
MEGVGDRAFRKAMAAMGGFDEAVREFLRVPRNPHIPSLAQGYIHDEMAPFRLAAQIMGSEPGLMAEMAQALENRGAPRIDLNCGCPSNTVTGRGAGSSLLKEPRHLYEIAKAMVQAVKIPVTLKMRSGYEDISLFHDNLKAAEESGVEYITLHPRTKVDGYGPPARWDLIAEAKSILKIPLVGNGDILNVESALKMLKETQCDALMIGRGSVINPYIFHEIKAHFSNKKYMSQFDLETYIKVFMETYPEENPVKSKVNKLKQLLGFLFKKNTALQGMRMEILTYQATTPESLLAFALPKLQENFS